MIFNGYRISRYIGEGSMGIVFEAVQQSLGRRICLKFIQPSRLQSRSSRRFFETEARSLAELNHPNIVTIFDVGEYEGYPYLAMEFVDGPNLLEYLSKKELSLEGLAALMERIGGAVAHMHHKGILHRDLKPSNILMDPLGEPKVADFGVAKQVGRGIGATDTGGVGTGAYIAPEVMAGNAYDHRADIYSLGVMAYLILTQKMPDQGVKPSDVNPLLSDATDRVILKALAPNPMDRYELAKTFVLDLSNTLRSSEGRRSSGMLPALTEIHEARTVAGEHPFEAATPIPVIRHAAPALKMTAPPPAPPATARPGPAALEESMPTPALPPLPGEGSGSRPVVPPSPPKSGGSKGLLVLGAAALLVVAGAAVVVVSKSGKPASTGSSEAPATLPPATKPTESAQAATTPTPSSERPTRPQTAWEFERTLALTGRTYCFLATGAQALYATTFNATMGAQGATELLRIDPATGTEQVLRSFPCEPQRGLSGVAVDEAANALFASLDTGAKEGSAVYRMDLQGTPTAGFGNGGMLATGHRTLGLALHGTTLYVLADWGLVERYDAATGAAAGDPITLRAGGLFRDIALTGNTLGAYGNGLFAEVNLTSSTAPQVTILMENMTPRSTEGLGADPVTGAFVLRAFESPSLLSVRGEDKVLISATNPAFSGHFVDLAVSPDGKALYASDLLRKAIHVFRTPGAVQSPTPTPARPTGVAQQRQTPAASTPADPAQPVEGGWREYSEEGWTTALSRGPKFMALLQMERNARGRAFWNAIVKNESVSKKLEFVPAFWKNVAGPGSLDPHGNMMGTPPELVVYDAASGKAVARFGSDATAEEILETLTLLDIK